MWTLSGTIIICVSSTQFSFPGLGWTNNTGRIIDLFQTLKKMAEIMFYNKFNMAQLVTWGAFSDWIVIFPLRIKGCNSVQAWLGVRPTEHDGAYVLSKHALAMYRVEQGTDPTSFPHWKAARNLGCSIKFLSIDHNLLLNSALGWSIQCQDQECCHVPS